jgi:hypothetical protein
MTTQASKEQAFERLAQDLRGPFDLSIDRKPETQYFHMQTQFIHMGFDGRRTGVETYLLRLRCIPAALSGKSLDEYMCREFGLQINNGGIVTLPALRLFNYQFDLMSGIVGKGPVFGIPHEPFGGMKDSLGNPISPDISYAAYNNFVDFHGLSDVFSRPMKFGKGIQDLKYVGDRVIHVAAFTEASVSLDKVVKPGSVFHNGEITLELKGISLVDHCPCALVNYDSGESTLRMTFAQSNNEEVMTEGGSEYTGDLYIDLATGWLRKATLDEFVITQSNTTRAPNKTPSYTVRHLLLRLISQQDFEKQISILP